MIVVGAGLAGSEAAWQIAQKGIPVELYEMRPQKTTPAHQTGYFAELVCSNSLRAVSLLNAVGLLKEEMGQLNSLIIQIAQESRLPAGGALAVDREEFARRITDTLQTHHAITVFHEELSAIPEHRPVIIATGPLTSPSLASYLESLTGQGKLYFYDAVAPIVTYESIDLDKAFFASRYGKGGDDYINCPMNEAQYEIFWQELCKGEIVQPKEFEKEVFFEGCMPVEVLASRGRETLRYGPLKPVGIVAPDSQEKYHAVVQLRKDNKEGTLYNMVGFQTRLKWAEQKRVFQLIPGLEKAEFVRYGVMHRNTFINSPLLMEPTLEMRDHPGLFFAGQMTGVEGYVESAATGIIAGINAICYLQGKQKLVFPPETAIGALTHYITTANPCSFQPMNVNFGIMAPLKEKVPKKRRKEQMAERSLETLSRFRNNFQDLLAQK